MVFFIIAVTLVAAAVVSWISLLLDKRKTDVKGPLPFPFIGNGHLLAVDASELVHVLKRLEDEYKGNVQIHFFSKRYIFTSDPKVLEAILTSNELMSKGTSYKHLKPWFGEGLLTSNGAKWKAHRKFLTPAFHFNILQNFLPVFCKNNRVLLKKLQGLADGKPVDMYPIVALAALDNITESIMGVSLHTQCDRNSEFVEAVDTMTALSSLKMRNPFVAPDGIFNLLPYKTQQDKALEILHGQTNRVIRARQEDLKKLNKTDLGSTTDTGIKNKQAFLDLLLLAEVDGQKISEESVRDEVNTFMVEGHDPTTSGIAFCLYCLSYRDDVQEKIYEEQKSIFGDDLQRDPAYSELQQMKYLELVIKETLRMYPAVPLIERDILKDTNIAGFHVPAGTAVVMDFFNMQRDPALYDNPLEFIPERFETSRNPFHWLPFSAGARNCIGQKFAMMELKTTIAMVVNNFKILPAGVEPKLSATLVLRSQNGIHIKLKARKKNM